MNVGNKTKSLIFLFLIILTSYSYSQTQLFTVFDIIYFYLTLSYIYYRITNLDRKSRIESINFKRKLWLFRLIEIKFEELNLATIKLKSEFLQSLGLPLDDIYRSELSQILSVDQDEFHVIPDLLEAEREILEQEARISKILVLIVFIPMLFYFTHLMNNISYLGLILNSINLTLIIEQLTYQLRNPLILHGWADLRSDLQQYKNLAILEPYYFFFQSRKYFDNIYNYELSISPILLGNFSASDAFKQIGVIILNLDQDYRYFIINEFLDSIKNIAQIENIHKTKWYSFRIQFILVTTILIMFIAILTSLFKLFHQLSVIFFNQLGFTVFNFNHLAYLDLMTFLITIIMIYLLSQTYLNNKARKRFLVFWMLEYLTIFYGLELFFILIFN